MARGTALYDFKATDTRRTDLSEDAKNQVARDIQLLDLWVSKDLNIGSQRARVRVGNQVISWGESIFAIGGINSTNSLDFQKLSIPGTQLKEAVLPAPIVSIASGLGHGINMEAYYQVRWNPNRLPPVGTYFSVADILGKGRQPFFIDVSGGPNTGNFGGLDPAADPTQATTFAAVFRDDKTPKNSGQYGVAMHYKPEGISLDLGFYFMNYHDKMPVLSLMGDFTTQWTYLENRKLYGVSANFPVGNWAVGWELSYRPKDAVSLTSCFGTGPALDTNNNPTAGPVDCPMFIDEKKFQMHLTGILSLTPGDHGWFLDILKADTATFIGEVVGIRYPGVSPNKRYTRNIGGVDVVQVIDAGYAFWPGPPTTGDRRDVQYRHRGGGCELPRLHGRLQLGVRQQDHPWVDRHPRNHVFPGREGEHADAHRELPARRQVDEHVHPVQPERADPLAGGDQLHELLGNQPAAGRQGLHRRLRHPQLLISDDRTGRRRIRGAGPGRFPSSPDGGSRPKSTRGGGREPCC